MPVGADNIARFEPAGDDQSEAPMSEGSDLAAAAPLCGAVEFGELMAELVADEAPRLFAVVQELGTRVDLRIAAWGLAFEDFAEVVGVDRGTRARLKSPERAARLFSRRPQITARVEWVKPEHPVVGTAS